MTLLERGAINKSVMQPHNLSLHGNLMVRSVGRSVVTDQMRGRMLFQLRRRRRIWRGKSRRGKGREGSDITLMHRCKSSCNRDFVCTFIYLSLSRLSAMSERTGLIMSGKKKDKGMWSSDAFLRAAHCQLICVCVRVRQQQARRNATTARALQLTAG